MFNGNVSYQTCVDVCVTTLSVTVGGGHGAAFCALGGGSGEAFRGDHLLLSEHHVTTALHLHLFSSIITGSLLSLDLNLEL